MPQLDGKQIKDLTVDTAQLAAGAVETAKIEDLNVTEAKIGDSQVTTIKINDTAVTEAKLHTSVAGAGLTGGGGSALAVGAGAAINVDPNDIDVKVKATGAVEIDTDELDVKDLGIDEARLADLSVATGKIQNDAVDEAKLDLGATYDFAGGGGGVQVPTPSAGNDAANKSYVDNVASGLTWKESVVAKTDAWSEMSSYTFTGGEWTGVTSAPTFDGVTLADQERVLVTHGEVTTPEAAPGNGIFYYDATAQKLIRTADADTWDELVAAAVFVEEGTSNADTGWVCIVDAGGTLDTTDVEFTQFTGGATYTGGDGIDVTGTVISADLLLNGGLKIDTAKIAVEPTDFAGTGLEDDGADNLRIATAAAGDGLQGGGGVALAVKPDTTSGGNVANVVVIGSAGVGVRIDDDSIKVNGSNQLVAATDSVNNQETANGAPTPSSGDDSPTGIVISGVPAGEGIVHVYVNGLKVECGDGSLLRDCYFDDGASGARAFGAIQDGDELYWNGAIAGYELAASDRISFVFQRVWGTT